MVFTFYARVANVVCRGTGVCLHRKPDKVNHADCRCLNVHGSCTTVVYGDDRLWNWRPKRHVYSSMRNFLIRFTDPFPVALRVVSLARLVSFLEHWQLLFIATSLETSMDLYFQTLLPEPLAALVSRRKTSPSWWVQRNRVQQQPSKQCLA